MGQPVLLAISPQPSVGQRLIAVYDGARLIECFCRQGVPPLQTIMKGIFQMHLSHGVPSSEKS
jgi:hypothetical protein